jgi:RNA polymerase primary sigma factor
MVDIEKLKTLHFVDSELFTAENMPKILEVTTPEKTNTDWYIPFLRGKLSFAVKDSEVVPFTSEQERVLFFQLNVAKKLSVQIANKAEITAEDMQLLERYEKIIKNRISIISSNYLPLTISFAKKFNRSGINFDDCLSEANYYLLHAIDMFDVSRENKFSTYLYYSIQNCLIRLINEKKEATAITISEYINENKETGSIENCFSDEKRNNKEEIEMLDTLSEAIKDNTIGLNDDERTCVILRWLVGGEKRTHKEVGDKLGKSGEWVRLKEVNAFKKIENYLKLLNK